MENHTVNSKRQTPPEERIRPELAKKIFGYFKHKGLTVQEFKPIDNKLFAVLVNGWFAVGVITTSYELQFIHKVKL